MKPPKPNFKKAKEEMERVMKDARKYVKIPNIEDIFKNKNGKYLSYVKEIKEIDGLVIIRLKGYIDTYTIPAIRTNFVSKAKKYLDKNILLDFKEATHVDSTTLASLIQLLNELKKRNKKLGIANATPLLKKYLDINKLRSMIQIYKNEDAALKDLLQN